MNDQSPPKYYLPGEKITMKLLAAIQAKRLKQVPAPVGRFARIEPQHEVMPDPNRPGHFQWKFGVELFCVFSGPEDAREHLAKQAMRLIAQEAYGEIATDLMELVRILMEEQYRADGDPTLQAIENMLRKIRGEP
jgi:hypothetical protein